MTASLIVYALIGFAVGTYAAAREIQDGMDTGSAGAAGVFVALFWPIVAAVVVLGVAADGLARLLGWLGRNGGGL